MPKATKPPRSKPGKPRGQGNHPPVNRRVNNEPMRRDNSQRFVIERQATADPMDSTLKSIDVLGDTCSRLLDGIGLEIVSGVLVGLIGRWLACHPKQDRDGLLRTQYEAAIELSHLYERDIYGAAGHPGNHQGKPS